ncbi:hypothetical protein MESS2_p40003 [Mesorhizobium metallidurans STM 2683]|uniref:Uncharacterized protein n=1 Tax=Mesorhizobium metallidurans STM 2683 TaxID=1297569 RepID=M5EWT0_9HYPH|nr:hypothetical protein MESS2_p40003 [Mesorhizobium metallidurans STM 2683]
MCKGISCEQSIWPLCCWFQGFGKRAAGHRSRPASDCKKCTVTVILFRVAQEPRRLWRRYYDTNTAYAALLCREFWDRRARRKVGL